MQFFRRALFALNPEMAHRLAIGLLSCPFPAQVEPARYPCLATRVAGLHFPNPVGLAAGFDKNAQAVAGLSRLGFGFVEAGTVTPLPQAGNPAPRLFRLEEDRAIINRMGFNNQGVEAAIDRLRRLPAAPRVTPVGLNVGLNKERADKPEDYKNLIVAASQVADYVTVNISSPNTPGLRGLQTAERFAEVARIVREAKQICGSRAVPVFVKLAPDISREELEAAADMAAAQGIDALIMGNTTVSRPLSLRSAYKEQAGGLSGAPLAGAALERLTWLSAALKGRVPIVACGGIASGSDVWRRLKAGAACVQIYTAFVYEGPLLMRKLLQELAEEMQADGVSSLQEWKP